MRNYKYILFLAVGIVVFGCSETFYLKKTIDSAAALNKHLASRDTNYPVDEKHKLRNLFDYVTIERNNFENAKARRVLRSITPEMQSATNSLFKRCIPEDSLAMKSYHFALRKVELEYDTLDKLRNAYQVYWFPAIKKGDWFGTYFQSDAFLKQSLGTVLEDMKIISGQYNSLSRDSMLLTTNLSYFSGLYFYDLDKEGHIQLNLCTPCNILGDRKVFRINCCASGKPDICDINPDWNSTAVKSHEYRKFNPDKIFATNPYTLYYRTYNQLQDWALKCEPIVPLLDSGSSDNSCICENKFKYRVVFNNTIKDFKAYRKNNTVFSIAFDRNGDIYPVTESEKGFAPKCNNICDYYASLRALYEAQTTKSYDEYEKKQIEHIQRSINEETSKLNKDPDNVKLTFLIADFNNSQEQASEKLDSLIDKISNLNTNKKHIFVKILWDGTYVSDNDRKDHLPGNFRYATGTSYEVGDKLRQLIKRVDLRDIYFVSHSLGANIVCESMFNQISKVPDRLKKNAELFYKANDSELQQFSIPVMKNFHAALIAPAMPGENTFRDLFDERINKLASSNNYSFVIGFNNADLTLKRELNPYFKGKKHTRDFSSTTLGYSEEENKNTQKMFLEKQKGNNSFDFYNFSEGNSETSGHDLLLYIRNPQYEVILKKLYQQP
ncbi:MAG: alpha/beta hydrolase [Bacteroidetes bacterium]|jgi:hypothetical protein|nr:alpha/beta hydrolase [Bacteroidota bacterium]